MFNVQQVHFIVYILFAMHLVWYGIVGGWLLYWHKQQHDRSRIFIGCHFLYLAFGAGIFITTALCRGDMDQFLGTILEPYPLLLSFLSNMLTIAYLVEVLHPRWLTVKRTLLALSPWVIVSLAWVIYHGLQGFTYDAITHLTDVSQVLPHIHETDVWLRVLIWVLPLPYLLLVPFIPYNWRTSNVHAVRITWLKVLVVLCIVGFMLGMGLRLLVVMIGYLVLLDILSILVFVTELRDRIPVPERVLKGASNVITAPELSALARHLQQLMEQGFWMNPDIQRDNVCRALGTNYTYLSSAIHELGYANFADMINQQRVQYVHNQLLQDHTLPVSDLLFQAGFRSRSTAVRSFIQTYHCTPTDMVRGLH